MADIPVHIRENSSLARLAAWRFQSSGCALVLGSVIHIWGVTKSEFLLNKTWLRHEIRHVRQFRRYGWWGFMWRYLYYSLRYGYKENPLEREARLAAHLEEEL
jgi:hypothetical protein